MVVISYCSLRPKILVVLAFDFYVYIQIDDLDMYIKQIQ
jgi:hypothetical protein